MSTNAIKLIDVKDVAPLALDWNTLTLPSPIKGKTIKGKDLIKALVADTTHNVKIVEAEQSFEKTAGMRPAEAVMFLIQARWHGVPENKDGSPVTWEQRVREIEGLRKSLRNRIVADLKGTVKTKIVQGFAVVDEGAQGNASTAKDTIRNACQKWEVPFSQILRLLRNPEAETRGMQPAQIGADPVKVSGLLDKPVTLSNSTAFAKVARELEAVQKDPAKARQSKVDADPKAQAASERAATVGETVTGMLDSSKWDTAAKAADLLGMMAKIASLATPDGKKTPAFSEGDAQAVQDLDKAVAAAQHAALALLTRVKNRQATNEAAAKHGSKAARASGAAK